MMHLEFLSIMENMIDKDLLTQTDCLRNSFGMVGLFCLPSKLLLKLSTCLSTYDLLLLLTTKHQRVDGKLHFLCNERYAHKFH